MKYFTARSDAEFARKAFTAAGLDFDKSVADKNTDCLKAAVAAAKPAADAESILAEAAKENDELKAKLAEAEKSVSIATNFTSLSAATEAVGFKLAEAKDDKGAIAADKIAAQHKALVAKGARDLVAAAGHPGILESVTANPAEDAEKKRKEANAKLSGEDRIRADFNAQIRNLNLPRRQQN